MDRFTAEDYARSIAATSAEALQLSVATGLREWVVGISTSRVRTVHVAAPRSPQTPSPECLSSLPRVGEAWRCTLAGCAERV